MARFLATQALSKGASDPITVFAMPIQFGHFCVVPVTIAAVLLAACNKSPTSPSPTQPPTASQPPVTSPAPAPSRSPAETFSSTTVSITSDTDHYVGRGRSLTFTMDNAMFDAVVYNNGGWVQGQIRQKDSPTTVWGFMVMTPNAGATPIAPGTYNTARDSSSPAVFFDFHGDAHGCNRSTARLVVHEIELTPDRKALKNFRASFDDHHCEGRSPAMQGEIAILDPWR